MIRVMVVDDSAFMRRLISDMIDGSGEAEVVVKARDGRDALEKLDRYCPDIITMDVEMPEMDGLSALKVIGEKSDVPVLILSSHSREGSKVTLDALSLGAVDFIEKARFGDSAGLEKLKEDLIYKIVHIAGDRRNRSCPAPEALPVRKTPAQRKPAPVPEPAAAASPASSGRPRPERFAALVIGTSTGGPKTLLTLFKGLDRKPSIPVLVVQHMPREFTRSLADRLDQNCPARVVEATDGQKVEPGTIYIAPGDYHMAVERGRIVLSQEEKIHGVRPAADILFSSAAREYGPSLGALILTGMGSDGTTGLGDIRRAGGYTVAQDRETSVIYGMPGSAVAAGVIDEELPLEGIIRFMNTVI